MCTPLDEYQQHRLPTTSARVDSGQPGCIDRYWFVAYEPATGRALQFTLGRYQHRNVVDAGFVVVHDGIQHNVRASRSLRSECETHCGPLQLEAVESAGPIHLRIGRNGGGVHGELDWTGELPIHEQGHHCDRLNGRVAGRDGRYDQIGSLSGWLEIDGARRDIDSWWAYRDQSWGVSANRDIPEPFTGLPPNPSEATFAFLFFSTERYRGHVRISRLDHTGDISVELIDRATGATLPVNKLAFDAAFVDEKRPRRFTTVSVRLTTTTGESVTIEAVATGPAVVMQGLGYGGYDDGLGLGVYRGDNHIETDRYNVSHPVEVTMPDSTVTRPRHRVQPVRIQSRSRGCVCPGIGGLTLVAESNVDSDGHLRLTNNPDAHPRHQLIRRR